MNDTTTVNNYTAGAYDSDGEFYIDTSTDPHRLTANEGKVYIRIQDMDRLLRLLGFQVVKSAELVVPSPNLLSTIATLRYELDKIVYP